MRIWNVNRHANIVKMRLTETKMARKTQQSAKSQIEQSAAKTTEKAALTPRQVALVMPLASAAAGPSFETALETLNGNLAVYKLWQGKDGK